MNFKEYLAEPIEVVTRHHGVEVFDDDYARAISFPSLNMWLITLSGEINGNIWEYQYILKGDSNSLWVQDEDGNPDRRSCFVYAGTELKYQKRECSMYSEECNKKKCDDCFHVLSLI